MKIQTQIKLKRQWNILSIFKITILKDNHIFYKYLKIKQYVSYFESFLAERFSLRSDEPGSSPINGNKIILELLIYKIKVIAYAVWPAIC